MVHEYNAVIKNYIHEVFNFIERLQYMNKTSLTKVEYHELNLLKYNILFVR